MRELDELIEEDTSGVVFRDVILLALIGFVAMVVLLLPHLHAKLEASERAAPAGGNVIVEIHWPDGIDTDVDLWVQAPGDVAVGFANADGRVFNLLRDDLGKMGDATPYNYELSYSRGQPAGEYTVNVHLYRNLARVYPVPVKVTVSARREEDKSARQILATDVLLERPNEELTALRFVLDAEGKLAPGSVNSVYRSLLWPGYEKRS